MGICHEADLPLYFPLMAAALGAAYTLGGRVADAVPLLTQAVEQATARETVAYQVLCRLSLGEAQMLAHRLEEAHALAERALALARGHQERGHQAYALRLLVAIAMIRLDHRQRRSLMATTVIRLFEEAATVHRALEALTDEGFPRDELNLIAHHERGGTPEAMAGWAPRVVAVPGVGAILAIGPIGAALSAMAGEVAGEGLMRVLMDRGAPTDEAHACVEGMRRGGVLVLVDTDEDRAEQAGEVLRRCAAGDHGALAASWRRAGDTRAPP